MVFRIMSEMNAAVSPASRSVSGMVGASGAGFSSHSAAGGGGAAAYRGWVRVTIMAWSVRARGCRSVGQKTAAVRPLLRLLHSERDNQDADAPDDEYGH